MSNRARGNNRSDHPSVGDPCAPEIAAAMRRAIRVAEETRPHPNPRVGCVVLGADGSVVGVGAHVRPGEPHAEPLALATAGAAAAGGTAVVTLEPCDHQGRTPPCTDALIAAAVSRVIVGAVDPDRRVSGNGIERLRAAGIEVVTDILTDEVVAMDPGYFHHRSTGRPLVTVKAAATLDGQVAAADGTSQWITSPEARNDVHVMRAASDVVLVGAGTLLADDPRLDVRIDGYTGRQPRPAVVLGTRPFPSGAALADRNPLLYSTGQGTGQDVGQDAGAGDADGPERVAVGADPAGGVDLRAVVADLGARDVLDVLVEGGPSLAASFLAAGLADRLVIYYGAMIAGGVGRPAFDGSFPTLATATPVAIDDVRMVGPDIRLTARPSRTTPVPPNGRLTGAA